MSKIISMIFIILSMLSTNLFAADQNAEIKWYGHSAFKVVTPKGKVLLVDPWITNPANKNGANDIKSLNKVDLIFITHGHTDHIGNAVEIAKKTGAKLVAIADLQKALVLYKGYPEKQAERGTTGSFGGEIELLDGEVSVKFVPAVHGDSMDTDKGQVYAGRAGAVLIKVKGGPSIYHTGDTDLFSDMQLLGGKVDIMMLCIGDKFTMGVVDAAKAVSFVKPQIAIPMHFGTFPVLRGTAEQFGEELAKIGLKSTLKVMNVGETIIWKR